MPTNLVEGPAVETKVPSPAGKIWKREQLSTPVFLPGEFYGQRSLAGYSPCGHKELDTTETNTFIFHFPFFMYNGKCVD